MPTVTLTQRIEKDEHGKFHAIVKLGSYGTIEAAEHMATMMMMIFQGAAQDGLEFTKKLPTESRKE